MGNRDLYTILGLDRNVSRETIESEYRNLRAKLQEDRFLEGDEGNKAASLLTELDTAYNDYILASQESFSDSDTSQFKKIENYIRADNLQEAQHILDGFNERGAEWHYLQSVIFFKKNWINESIKQLEISIQLDPENEKYKSSLNKIKAKVNDANKQFKSKGPQEGSYTETTIDETPQMGGNGCLEWCCQMALCNMALNCCCNCR